MRDLQNQMHEMREKHKDWYMFNSNIIAISNVIDLNVIEKILFEEKLESTKVCVKGWELIAYPFLGDGTIALIYELHHKKNKEIVNDYKVIIIDPTESMEPLLLGVTMYNQWVSAMCGTYVNPYFVVRDEEEETMLFRANDNPAYPEEVYLGKNVTRVITKDNGNIVMGYSCDAENAIIREYSADGKFIGHIVNADAVSCTDITTDDNDKVWYHLFPFNKIYCMDDGISFDIDVVGFDGFFFCNEGNSMITAFSTEKGQVLYQLEKQDNGFRNPTVISVNTEDEGFSTLCDLIACRMENLLFIGIIK